MGTYLIADGLWIANPQNWLVILQVALGLGFVIFVHELGHFAVAKMCGVRCDKFYLGFDIFGLKLFKKKWGETEYGIGILPLGGYVKMLGQDDNPTKTGEAIESSKASAHDGLGGGDLPAEPSAETPVAHDPRSYRAKSVPQRMAIISAGVIMNLIFAVLMAALAYRLGVPEETAGVSQAFIGEAAWQAGLRPGDHIVQVGDVKNPRHRDLLPSVVLGKRGEPVDLTIHRPNAGEPFQVPVTPIQVEGRTIPMLGIASPSTTELFVPTTDKMALFPWTAVGQNGQFQDRDRFIKIGDREIHSHADLHAVLATQFDQPLEITVERLVDNSPTTVNLSLPAVAYRDLGIAMKYGPISALQQGSPAENSGLQIGDTIIGINGEPPVDPLFLSQWFRKQTRSGLNPVEITVSRPNESVPLTFTITPREADWLENPAPIDNAQLSVPSLGIAYAVESTIEAVRSGSPADGQLAPGDTVTKAEWVFHEENLPSSLTKSEAFDLEPKKRNWVLLMSEMQGLPPSTTVKLTTADGKTVELASVASDQWFNEMRGMNFHPLRKTRQATSVTEALALGFRETKEQASQVLRFLGALVNQSLSPKNLGGPATIATAAASFAEKGFPNLLIFLTMLSANLAVVNFLPIPILDGGHMVFLTLEGILGKPVSEKVEILLTYIGFAIVMSLMIFVIGIDIHRFWPF